MENVRKSLKQMNKKLEKNVSYYFDTMWPIKVVDKSFISVIICVTGVIISFNFAYLGFYCGVVVLACYLAGIYFWKHIISSWLELLLKYLNSNYIPTNHLKKNADNQKCEVQVPDSIDQALEQIFYRFLNQYISNWYCHISSDASFQLEVRAGIQHVVTAVCNRLTKVEIDRFLLCRAIPVFLHHAGKTNHETSRVHIALHSRKSEILYLQNLSKILLKYLLPHSSVNCRLYTTLLREITSKSLLLSFSDTVCNPGVLNHLVLRCFDRKFGTNCSLMLETSEIIHVPLLQNFLNDRQINSCYWTLRPTINDILKDEELRNTFMQYLKGCGTEYILQFCLDVDSFNEKMLKPELNTEELDNLYKDAWDLFSVYFSNYSPNCIRFHKDLASPLRKALSKDILKLRTTATLFEAYEYAFSLLEEYCQDFYNSAEFYRWLYGQHDDNDSITLNKLHCNTFIEIKTQKLVKMKGVSKRNNHLHERAQNLCADTTDSETQSKEMGVNYQSNLVPEIDINKWKITISEVNSRVNPFTGKTFSVLSIRVFGENNADWLIQRTLDDLHSLHSKLLEIDERTDKIQFPSFKSLTVHTEHIPAYEDYLNEAIKLSNFQNSYLLYNFLTSSEYINDEQVDGDNVTDDDDEDEFNEEAEGEEGLDKIFHKFSARPPIFKKEQSQNLETFVNSVILSCIPRNYAHDDIEENKSVNKMHLKVNSCDLYENNSNIEENSTVKMICDTEETELSNKCFLTPFTLVIYVAFKIYCIREYVIKFVLTWKSVFGNIVDQFILNVTNIYLNIFMKNSSPSYLINTIEWAVFDNDIKFNEEETKKKITRLLLDAKNDWLYPVYNVIFKNLQDSKRNKELFYNLADIIMEELFPEILTPSAESVK